MEIIFSIIGLIVGGICAWFIQSFRFLSKKGLPLDQAEILKNQIQNLELEKAQKNERIKNLEGELGTTQKTLAEKQNIEIILKEKLAREETERKSSEKRVEEQRKDFDKIKEQLKVDFQNLANSILDEKTKKFTAQNKENLDILLKPLGEKIKEFKEKVEKTHETQTRDSVALHEQIKQLTELNVHMAEEANNLTNALKGQSKTMGNWGELVLETILENSGLKKGEEYLIQESFKTEEGTRFQPDVIINLPGKKHLVIDSKVSLVAYERYCSSSDQDKNRDKHIEDHIDSIRTHINELKQKNYQELYQISSPDFVMMFVPLDPALVIALQNDKKLFVEAFEKGIFLVCPATLLFALRTIATLWRHEKQNENAIEIARRGGALYDKFVGFCEQLRDLGACIRKTQECYDESISKLKTGKGNLIRHVEMIRELGARTSKVLPDNLIENANDLLTEHDNEEKEKL